MCIFFVDPESVFQSNVSLLCLVKCWHVLCDGFVGFVVAEFATVATQMSGSM